MLEYKYESWLNNSDAINQLGAYLDAPALEGVMCGTNVCGIFKDDKRLGTFTWTENWTYEGENLIEIRHLVGEFPVSLMYLIFKAMSEKHNALIRVVSDRAGFDKHCQDHGFEKVSTIWQFPDFRGGN